MSALDDLYQLRSQVEENTRTLFEANEIIALTRTNAPEEFQQVTPRVEIKCTIGAATGHRFPCPDGFARFDRWRFNLAIQAVTRPAKDGVSALHEQFLGRIRNLCSTLAQSTWEDTGTFPNIRIAEPLRDTGDNNTLKSSSGCEYSVLSFAGTLCIRESAWPVVDAGGSTNPSQPILDDAGINILDDAAQTVLSD